MTEVSRIKPVERATNRSWDEWVAFMERVDARSLDHKGIALKVYEELDGSGVEPLGWWTQAVTVAYEQYIGRRIPGQRPDGTFQLSVSKATKLGMRELMDAWVAFAGRDAFVAGLDTGDVKVSGTGKRITWRAKVGDGSSIIVTSEPKANGTASIVATQLGLATLELNDEARAGWAAAVSRFVGGL
ncbi:hypothetical protein [Paractinoplanes rishiriensis]|uniref:DUF4287 domain-containing protein n=1 Tax=Paractinoplanes rishiriensis TaxID=1050105 RepID=A0A919MRW7_9ACTN|nr:hypothetical protein [Actinoplanes rishiriensis]GIE97641.1 hypothetical protein Ari01nite_51060 [Actinoplanes rishiriensis]